jgi:hypothetical protein
MDPFISRSKRLILLHLTRQVRSQNRLSNLRSLCLLRRSTTLGAFLLTAALSCVGCDDNSVIPTPTPPAAIITESIVGNLTPNSVRLHGLQIQAPGAITATYVSLAQPATATDADGDGVPDPQTDLALGLDIGTLIGTTCQVNVSRVNVGINAAVSGTATAAGTICIRVYDSSTTGLAAPVDYTVVVNHF